MDLSKILNIYNYLEQDDFSFIYRGVFDNVILNKVTEFTNLAIYNVHERKRTLTHKLIYLTIESFQNVAKYSETKNADVDVSDLFMFRRIDFTYFITTANLINSSKASKIEARLKRLNEMSPRELTELYYNVLTNQQFNEKGGAGLGFIEMLRKAKNKLEFNFIPIDENYKLFLFQIPVSIGTNGEKGRVKLPLEQAYKLYEFGNEISSLLTVKSQLTIEGTHSLIHIIRDNLNSVKSVKFKRFMRVLIELLMDLNYYTRVFNQQKEALIITGIKDENPYILVGSYIDIHLLESKLRVLEKVMDMEKEEQEQFYNQLLLGESNEDQLRSVAIVLKSKNFEYQVDFIDKNLFFFVQKVEI